MIFPELYKEYEKYLNDELRSYEQDSLLQPIAYIMHLPAKRIRAVLVLLGYNLVKPDIQSALPIAHAYELFHNFTLMHDDIMDEAATRRGQPSTHSKFGLNSAILSGDALMVIAFQYLQQNLDPAMSPKIWKHFNSLALEVCQGQQMDLDFEAKARVSKEEYIEMIRLKTAVFLGHALRAGVIKAGGADSLADSLYQYGESLGIAFQIQDDYLDLYGNATETGKQKGGDILRKKKSYPVSAFFAKASNQHIADFSNIYTSYTTDEAIVEAAINLFSYYDIAGETKSEVARLYSLATASLDACDLSPDKKDRLDVLKSWLQGRNK